MMEYWKATAVSAALGVAVSVSGGLLATAASAAIEVCADGDVAVAPGTPTPFTTSVTMTTVDPVPVPECIAVGDGGKERDEFLALFPAVDYDRLAKSDGDAGNPLTFASIVTILTGSMTGGDSGSFSFAAPSGYTDLVMLFKFGRGQNDPSWFAFSLPAGFTGGGWSAANSAGPTNGLSHVSIYGVPAQVPIPAAGLLLAGALGGLGLMRRLRRAA